MYMGNVILWHSILDNQVYYLTFNGFMKKVLGRLHNMYLIRIKYSGDVPWFYN